MERLVEWDRLEVRIRGERLAAIVGEIVREKNLPIDYLALQFDDGVLRVEGKVRKTLLVPFRLSVSGVTVTGGTAEFQIGEISSFLGIPIPRFLLGMLEERTGVEGISYHPETRAVAVRLDRFLPPNVEVEVETIRIIDGGIAVTLGRGGADLPPRRS